MVLQLSHLVLKTTKCVYQELEKTVRVWSVGMKLRVRVRVTQPARAVEL